MPFNPPPPSPPKKRGRLKDNIVRLCVHVSDCSAPYSHYEVASKTWQTMRIYTSQKISLSQFQSGWYQCSVWANHSWLWIDLWHPYGGCLFRPNHSFALQVCGEPGSVMLGRSSLKSLHYHKCDVLPGKPIHVPSYRCESWRFRLWLACAYSGVRPRSWNLTCFRAVFKSLNPTEWQL